MQNKVLSFSLRASGWLLSNLGKPFPGLTARVFFRFYATPPKKKKLRESEQALREKARLGVSRFSKYPFDPRLIRIATYRWSTGGKETVMRKKVLLMHGWGGTALGFQALTEQLVKDGYEVIAYDGPAHGYSEGRRTNLVQWMHVLDQYLRQEETVYAIIGHSAGALTAALTLARKGHEVPRLILATPPLSAPSFFQDTFDQFRIRPKVIAGVYGLVRTKLKDDLLTMDLRYCVGRFGPGRVLLIYDERDQLVRQEEVDSFLVETSGIGFGKISRAGFGEATPIGSGQAPRIETKQASPIETLKIKGEGHFRILRNPEVIRRIASFLEG